jgi:hypothetical protein
VAARQSQPYVVWWFAGSPGVAADVDEGRNPEATHSSHALTRERAYENLSPLPELCSVSQLWLTAPPSGSPGRPRVAIIRSRYAAPQTTPITKTQAPNVIAIHASYIGSQAVTVEQ